MKKQKYVLNLLVILGLTIGALWFALKDNYKQVLSCISKMNSISLIIILAWGALFTAVWGLVYFVLGRKYTKNYRPGKGMIVAFVGAFFSGITPSSTGGQFAQAYIMKKQGIKVSDGASLLWADFIIYQTTMMIYVTILFVLKFGYYSAQSAWFNIILLGYVINAIVIVALYTIALFPNVYVKLSGKLVHILGKIHVLKNPEKTLDSWTLSMQSFTGEIKHLSQDKKSIVICVLINFIRLSLYYSLPFVIALALHIPLKTSQFIDVMALSSFVTMANSFIPIPGASGGTEVVFALLFGSMMNDLTGAVLVLWRFSTYHFVLIIGGILFVLVKNYYEKKDNEIRLEED